MIGFDNGVFQEISKISVPITSLSVNRGYGVFEFFEVINGKPFYGERHIERFKRSLNILKLKTDFDNRFSEIIEELIDSNDFSDFYIKIFVLPHDQEFEGFYKASMYAFPTEMPQYNPELYEAGAHLITKKYHRFLSGAKSTNYLSGQYWFNEFKDDRTVDVLYHNGGTVQETSRGNIFVVKDGQLFTPEKDILKGVTRSIVLDILKEQNLSFSETDVSLETLFGADEVFLSSTTKLVMPVTQIDDNVIGKGEVGDVTLKIMAEFQKIKKSYCS